MKRGGTGGDGGLNLRGFLSSGSLFTGDLTKFLSRSLTFSPVELLGSGLISGCSFNKSTSISPKGNGSLFLSGFI